MNKSKCQKTKVFNPKTGRCVLKTGKIGRQIMAGKKSPCSNDKVYNPQTGRCVLKSGNIGKKIMAKKPAKKSKVRSKKPAKKCSSGKYLNSKTNRCKNIKKPPNEKSASGKKLSRNAMRSKPSLKTQNLLIDCTRGKNWTKKRKLGKGAAGQVYRACRSSNCNFIVKEQKADDEFKNEIRLLQHLQGWKHVPKLYDAWICKGKGYMVIEELRELSMNKKTAYIQLKKIFKQLHSRNVVQPDCHDGNIMQRADGTIVLIDFGWGAHFPTKTTKIYDGKLSQQLNRKVSMKEMIIWEAAVLADDFGTNKDIDEAERRYNEILD